MNFLPSYQVYREIIQDIQKTGRGGFFTMRLCSVKHLLL